MLTLVRQSIGAIFANVIGPKGLIIVDRNLGRIGLKSKTIMFALQYCLPFDPLANHAEGEIEVFIPVAEKDLKTALISAASAVRNSRNAVKRVTFACPSTACHNLVQRVRALEEYFEKEGRSAEVLVTDEANLLAPYTDLLSSFQSEDKGWLIQQILKLQYVTTAQLPVLVLDADTVLTLKRTFVGPAGEQLLAVSTDTYRPYHNHLWKLLRLSRMSPLSFVSHHQLMQPGIVQSLGKFRQSLRTWVKFGIELGRGGRFAASEYQTYGQLLLASQGPNVRLGSWSNRNATLDEFTLLEKPIHEALDLLSSSAGKGIGSISFHTYL